MHTRVQGGFLMRGFSLVELSIVLVILGLLTGGILAGQSLIRAAELRSVSVEHSRYVTSMQGFRDKYFGLPGDLNNATSFWGDQATGTASCANATIPDGTPGTCNGNGDGFIGAGDSNNWPENMRLWQHLSFAGLIEGNYSGYLNGGTQFDPGNNIPKSRLSRAVWTILYRTSVAPNNVYNASGNFALLSLGAAGTSVWGTVINPEESWNIDTKMDDGKPATGSLLAGGDSTYCVTPNVIDYGTASAVTPSIREYNLAVKTNECRLWFKM